MSDLHRSACARFRSPHSPTSVPIPLCCCRRLLRRLRLRLLFLVLLLLLPCPLSAELSVSPCNITAAEKRRLASKVVAMFDHAFSAYMAHAFPADELRPLSCTPSNSFKGLSVTLIDTLDTLILMRQWARFAAAVRHLSLHLSFAIDDTVSLFETTIRVLAGLLSAHAFLVDHAHDTGFLPHIWAPWYRGELLHHAVDLADRLLPAFDTPTGIPYGAINLQRGVDPHESRVASVAGAGSLLLEFGTVSRLTADPRYYRAAFRAMHALHSRASHAGLVGNHIDLLTGDWVAPEAGVGGSVDSFYEYMLKGYVLFGDARLLRMFREAYAALDKYVRAPPWNLDANMWTGVTTSLSYSSLAAFWPGVQVLVGDVRKAAETTRAHYAVWRRYGCLPEGYHVVEDRPVGGQVNYPLRPELVESVFYLHWATNDSSWVAAAKGIMYALEHLTKVECGYAAIKDASTHELEDIMPSFLLSETLKYLYLVFADVEEGGKPHWLRSGNYVFNTEAHPLRIAVEDVREILGSDFDDDEKSPNDSHWGERNAHRNAVPPVKCQRRPELESRLPCGYFMPGTDYPKLDPESLIDPATSSGITLAISNSVTRQLREREARTEGANGVNVGDLIFGSGWVCRVVQVEGHVISYTRLDETEAAVELLQHGAEVARRKRIEEEMARVDRRRDTCSLSRGYHAALRTNVCWS